MTLSGQLFSRVYLERGSPAQDSSRFRVRLSGYISGATHVDASTFARHLSTEGGIDVVGTAASISTFFRQAPIADVLDAITVEFKRLADAASAADFRHQKDYYAELAIAWRELARRALKEENLAYRVDNQGGVHYFVDEEFERNRVSALSALDVPQLAAVRDAFESAHRFLDPGSRDTKASVRSAFEAAEILSRLMYQDQGKLSRNLILQRLRPDAQAAAPDEVAKKAIGAAFEGLGDIIDGAHEYRHGQQVESTVAPPLDYAVFCISVVASALR